MGRRRILVSAFNTRSIKLTAVYYLLYVETNGVSKKRTSRVVIWTIIPVISMVRGDFFMPEPQDKNTSAECKNYFKSEDENQRKEQLVKILSDVINALIKAKN